MTYNLPHDYAQGQLRPLNLQRLSGEDIKANGKMNSWYAGTFFVVAMTVFISLIANVVSFEAKAQGFQPLTMNRAQYQKWNDRYQKRFGFGYPSSYNGFNTDSRQLMSLGQLLHRIPKEKRMGRYSANSPFAFDPYSNTYQNWREVFSGMKRIKPKEN
ncbi:Hypothetical predicted protein [Mytilus galloprovincialis]|uniref:Uncharacterized protein n=1 Tax=Mytilus galloprovincialis TaxID=29158 RepID=A0A8B6G6F3_MYTGA|nr:Hypothetical predicted protein [Mytilus galloprovincialis]